MKEHRSPSLGCLARRPFSSAGRAARKDPKLPLFGALLLALSFGACGDSSPNDKGDRSDASAATAGEDDAGGSEQDAGAAVEQGLMVTLDDGKIEGDMAGKARRFLNIPYAKPPLGALRFKAAVPNDAWQGTRHETEFVKGCPQLADQGAPASDNEDCLYLNVWAPDPTPSKAPVMVWIHGGGNFSGGTGIPIPNSGGKLWYDGQPFAEKQGVVLVTIQYRLGPFGFFAHPGLEQEGGIRANQGLYDQRLALSWVKKNIVRFGGDPDNVTIFGESAGSADVCYHVVSPGSKGLFHRAISESGGCTIRSVGPEQSLAKIGAQMVEYAKAVGCAEGAGQLACLRDKPITDLLANAMQPMPGAGGGFDGKWTFAAVLDGADGFLPDAPENLFNQGKIADVPYLLGSNNDEGTTFVLRAPALNNEADYMADLKTRFGDSAADVAKMYPGSDFNGNFNAARARVVGDSTVICSTHDTARRAAKAGRKVFLYNFNVWWSISPAALQAGHASEISHVFGTPYLPTPDADSEKVGDAMNHYWAQFAKSGDPNASDSPAVWPAFSADADKRLQLDASFKVLDNFRTKECTFWRQYYKVVD
jgi:para-nitrobenzyl esterase